MAKEKLIEDRNYLRMLNRSALIDHILAQPKLTELEQVLFEIIAPGHR